MFKWTEIKKWAKENNFNISKTPKVDEYFWEEKKYTELKALVVDLWNEKTNNVHLDHQKNYKKLDQGQPSLSEFA
jgi:hypothetical protein